MFNVRSDHVGQKVTDIGHSNGTTYGETRTHNCIAGSIGNAVDSSALTPVIQNNPPTLIIGPKSFLPPDINPLRPWLTEW